MLGCGGPGHSSIGRELLGDFGLELMLQQLRESLDDEVIRTAAVAPHAECADCHEPFPEDPTSQEVLTAILVMISATALRSPGVMRQCAAGLGVPAALSSAVRRSSAAATAGAEAPLPAGDRLAGKTCIVTGAAHGIGKATATLFASQGARVILADRDVATGEAVAELLSATYSSASHT